MPTVNFIQPGGERSSLEADEAESVMQAAVRGGLSGILGECGGNAMCATCHVYVEEGWLSRLPAMADDEDALLDGVASERNVNSRLSCQIRMTAGLDGLVLHLPIRQA